MTAVLNHAGNDYAAKLANMSKTPEQFQVAPRIYFHHHNYAKFHFDLGGSAVKSVAFANYRYITDDKREQDQLDLVADVPGTFIFTGTNTDVEAAMALELQKEATKDIFKTAQAAAAALNQQFDPNAPIVPVATQQVSVQHLQPTPGTQVAPVQQTSAVVGMQNSLSGTQAAEEVQGKLTNPANQTSAIAAAEAARQRLANMNK